MNQKMIEAIENMQKPLIIIKNRDKFKKEIYLKIITYNIPIILYNKTICSSIILFILFIKGAFGNGSRNITKRARTNRYCDAND